VLWPYDKLTKDLVAKTDLLSGDVVAVYPARLDRGKQPEKIIRLMAGVQRTGREPRLLIVDWQSQGDRFQTYMNELLELAEELGLEGKVRFTSRLDDRCSQGVPRHIVTELMDLSNVYVHPSRVETYSLVVHEAMLRGCLCVLNYDFPAMRELFGEAAIYMDFGSDRVDRTYLPDEQSFWNEEALRLIAELGQNRAALAKTTARRLWSPDALWRDFEPMLHLPAVGEA
jgi:glycosyltransferase involved in cell wall biosynthesis